MDPFIKTVEALYNLAVYVADVKDDPDMKNWASVPEDRKQGILKMMEPLYDLSTPKLQPTTKPAPGKTRY